MSDVPTWNRRYIRMGIGSEYCCIAAGRMWRAHQEIGLDNYVKRLRKTIGDAEAKYATRGLSNSFVELYSILNGGNDARERIGASSYAQQDHLTG